MRGHTLSGRVGKVHSPKSSGFKNHTVPGIESKHSLSPSWSFIQVVTSPVFSLRLMPGFLGVRAMD